VEILIQGNVYHRVVTPVEFCVDESWFNHIVSIFHIKYLTWIAFYQIYTGQIPDRPIQFENGDLRDSVVDFFQGCIAEEVSLGNFDFTLTDNEYTDGDEDDFEEVSCKLLK
jgi:hypothetical protein